MYLYEGGAVFDGTTAVARDQVATVIDTLRRQLPSDLQRKIIADIGSAGYKVESGDIDLFVDERTAIKHFGSEDAVQAKRQLADLLSAQGLQTSIKGRNVHVRVPYGNKFAQVDLMLIPDAKRVAVWHQHGPRGMYDDPNFKPKHLYILLNSLAKFKNMKVDAFAGTLNQRTDNSVVSNDRDQIAKILLNPAATGNDLNSVATVMKALEGDPDREGKLAQARQDVQKGVLTLPEQIAPGTSAWFRQMGHNL